MNTYHITELKYTPAKPKVKRLEYTKHAVYATKSDRYGTIPILEMLPTDFEIFNITIDNYVPVKYGIRFNYNDQLDMVLIIVPCQNKYKVVTTWFNNKDDNHKTLDLSRYKNNRS